MKTNLQSLVGRKIVKVDDDCCNSILLETEDGGQFRLETEQVDSGVYGIIASEEDPEPDNSVTVTVRW